jgi:hypothetical protein
MKKNVLALSIAAMVGSFAGVAQASVINAVAATAAGDTFGTYAGTALADSLVVNSNNVGHMLVVPYFTAQNGNMTVLHLSNTDQLNGKAVKIRFRGAANSDDVKDFQIYLSPGDIWTGAVAQGASGAATLYSGDKTCTVPAIPATGTDFATARLNAVDNLNGTREGYVEIFNMADIPSTKNFDKDGKPVNAGVNSVVYTLTKHVNGVAPCSVDSSAARSALNDIAMTNFTKKDAAAGADNANALGFGAATTGLAADWYILNLAQSTNYSGAATAIEAQVKATGAAGAANFVHFPQTSADSGAFFATAGTEADSFTADPLLRTKVLDNGKVVVSGPVVTPLFIDLPDMSTPYVSALAGAATDANLPKLQAAILTKALARTSVSNQYALDAGIKASTDWVFSMPTRRYSVAANYKATKTSDNNYRLYSDLSDAQASAAAVTLTGGADEWFTPANTRVDTRGNICVDAKGMRFFDREETTTGNAPIFSPAVAGQLSLCGETSVLSFSSTKVLGSSADLTATTMATPYVNGWTLVSVPNTQTVVAGNLTAASVGYVAGATDLGLPILGDAFIKVNNDSAGAGFASTFGITWGHRYGR